MAESIAERVAREIAEEFDLPLYDNKEDPVAEWMAERIQVAIDEAVRAEAYWWIDHVDECSSSHPAIVEHMAKLVGAPTPKP